jgi:xanthine dehydrogenase YagS FAD-binding subunit
VHVTCPGGDRIVPMPGLDRLSGDHPDRDTQLEPGEVVTAVTLPPHRPAPPALPRNAYKVPLAGTLIVRTLLELAP